MTKGTSDKYQSEFRKEMEHDGCYMSCHVAKVWIWQEVVIIWNEVKINIKIKEKCK